MVQATIIGALTRGYKLGGAKSGTMVPPFGDESAFSPLFASLFFHILCISFSAYIFLPPGLYPLVCARTTVVSGSLSGSASVRRQLLRLRAGLSSPALPLPSAGAFWCLTGMVLIPSAFCVTPWRFFVVFVLVVYRITANSPPIAFLLLHL